jgi:hypothetical protein
VGDFAELALLDQVACLDEMRRAPPLRADLHHAIVFTSGGEHGLALGDIDADRLLHPNVETGFHRIDHCQRVPMIRRGNQHQSRSFSASILR